MFGEDVINWIIEKVIAMIDSVLPMFNPDPQFIVGLDKALTWYIDINTKVAYLVPYDALVICLTIIFSISLFRFSMRIGKWILGMVRG